MDIRIIKQKYGMLYFKTLLFIRKILKKTVLLFQRFVAEYMISHSTCQNHKENF